MKILAAFFLLLSLAFAQSTAPTSNRVEWNPSAPDAVKELANGQTQKTVASGAASVSAMMDVTTAKRFMDPPGDGGREVTYVVIGIQNTSEQPIRIDGKTVTLRVVGKKEKELKRFNEDQIVERAWYAAERYVPTVSPGPGTMGSMGGGEKSVEAAITHQDLGSGDKRMQQGPEQALAQATKLRAKTLGSHELAPGQAVMGLIFFNPYEKKDKLELSVRIGEAEFVIPFSGPKAK